MPPKKSSAKDSAADGKAGADKEVSLEQALKEAARDAQLKILKEQRGKPDTDEATLSGQLEGLLTEHPGHLPTLQEELKRVAAANAKDNKSISQVRICVHFSGRCAADART